MLPTTPNLQYSSTKICTAQTENNIFYISIIDIMTVMKWW